MDTIIGLGKAGCNIASEFAQYSQYCVYKIGIGFKRTPTTYGIKKCEKIEDYEEKMPSLKRFFKDVNGSVLFVVAGSELVSSASLSVLKNLRHCKINVLYIKSDTLLLNEIQKKLEKLVFNVLQEYCRSGLFERLYLVSNPAVERSVGGISVKNYYEKINKIIVSTLHMINKFNHRNSISDTFCSLPIGARISSVGLMDAENNEEKMFFSLDNISDMVYYYAYSKKTLESDLSVMSKIKDIISEKNRNNIRATYGIFETEFEQDYVYCVNHTSIIQS